MCVLVKSWIISNTIKRDKKKISVFVVFFSEKLRLNYVRILIDDIQVFPSTLVFIYHFNM